MASDSHSLIGGNDTAKWGKDQNWAVVWFISVIILAPIFVSFLSKIDSWMYYNNDRVEVAGVKLYDDEKTRANRSAATNIASERTDPRAKGSLASAYQHLQKSE